MARRAACLCGEQGFHFAARTVVQRLDAVAGEQEYVAAVQAACADIYMADAAACYGAGDGVAGGMAFCFFAADDAGGNHFFQVFGEGVVGVDAGKAA